MRRTGSFRAKSRRGVEMKLEQAEANIAACIELARGKSIPILIDESEIKSMDRACRDCYARRTRNVFSAVAYMARSTMGKIVGNFYLGINKPSHPFRLFTSESDAVEWLRGFVREEPEA